MDPNETLRLILSAKDCFEAMEHCDDLADWLRKGGFAPQHPAKYWPGTGTGYSVLSPASDNGQKWEFVKWDRLGRKVDAWTLS